MNVQERQRQMELADDKFIPSNQLRRMWHGFKKRKVAVLGLAIVLFYLLLAIIAPLIAPYDPLADDLSNMLNPPSKEHLLGTDDLGRDILSRLLYGTTISMRVGFLAVTVGFAIGVPLGILAGYIGGRIDSLIMRAMDVMMAFPGMLLAVMFVSVLGPSLGNAIFAVGVGTVPRFARLARGETMVLRNSEFIEAAKTMGSSNLRIVLKHIIINIVSPLIVYCTISFGNAILETAGLGFLGIGAQPPTPEWGAILSSGRKFLLVAPHVTTFPGLILFILVLGLNLLGDGLRDVLDPKLKD